MIIPMLLGAAKQLVYSCSGLSIKRERISSESHTLVLRNVRVDVYIF
jgi:hypothetical protein